MRLTQVVGSLRDPMGSRKECIAFNNTIPGLLAYNELIQRQTGVTRFLEVGVYDLSKLGLILVDDLGNGTFCNISLF